MGAIGVSWAAAGARVGQANTAARTAAGRLRARQGCDRTVSRVKHTNNTFSRSGKARELDRAPLQGVNLGHVSNMRRKVQAKPREVCRSKHDSCTPKRVVLQHQRF